MSVSILTVSGTGDTAGVRCDDCSLPGPTADHPERHKAIPQAERQAEEQGFAHYPSRKLWVCPRCRIQRMPDHLKARMPNLCAQHGITVPPTDPPSTPTPPAERKRRAKSTSARPGKQN